MLRPLVVLLLLSTPLLAADPPKPGGVVQMLVAKIEGDTLVSSSSNQQTRSVTVTDKDGKLNTIQVKETVTTTTARHLENLKATDTDGKEISTADLKAKLKDGGLVVFLSGPLDAEWRKRMKSGVVFVEYAMKEEK